MIYICEYDSSASPELLQQYAEELPLPLYDGAFGGVKWQKRKERILAWMLLQYAIGERRLAELDIQRTASGKPYSAADGTFHFNISHCDTACACVIHSEKCGIDVEKKFSLRENLMRKTCHPEEYDRMAELPHTEKERQFRFLWSLKESYVKMDGRGLGYGMERVNLASLLPIKTGEWHSLDSVRYMAQEAELYTVAVCVKTREGEASMAEQETPRMTVLTESQLIQFWERFTDTRE